MFTFFPTILVSAPPPKHLKPFPLINEMRVIIKEGTRRLSRPPFLSGTPLCALIFVFLTSRRRLRPSTAAASRRLGGSSRGRPALPCSARTSSVPEGEGSGGVFGPARSYRSNAADSFTYKDPLNCSGNARLLSLSLWSKAGLGKHTAWQR